MVAKYGVHIGFAYEYIIPAEILIMKNTISDNINNVVHAEREAFRMDVDFPLHRFKMHCTIRANN